MTRPIVFISYSHKDEREKDQLLAHLGVLGSADLIDLWSDDRIGAGVDWEIEISRAIAEAKVAILLISANFLTSKFILQKEVPELLKRRDKEGITVFPVIAKACAWRMVEWLTKMNVRPKNGRPVWSDEGSHVDQDLADIVTEVGMIITKADTSPIVLATSTTESEGLIEETTAGLIQSFDDRDWDSLLRGIKDGICTPFIGPEVCQGIVPSDSEIAGMWAAEHAYPLEDSQNMSRVAQFLAIDRAPAFPVDEVVRHLKGITSQPNFNDPDEPHTFLARLPLPIYITTNYDNFMIQALKHRSRNANQELCRWNKYVEDTPSIFDADSKVGVSVTNPVVYHLFGHTEAHESMVLTEDDYLDFLVNIYKNQNIVPRQIEKALVKTSLLFIGYQLSDLRFRVLFRGLIASLERRFSRISVAVQLTPEPPRIEGVTSAHVREYLEKYLAKADVRVYWDDSFSFIKELRGRWEEFNDRN